MRTQQTSEWGHSEISIDSLPQVWFGWSLSEEPSTCKARAVRKTDWARSDLCTSRQGFLFCQRFITCWSLVCKKLARSPWIFDVTAEQKRRGPPLFIALFLSRYAPAADHLVCAPCRESIQADRFANGDKQFQSKSPRSMGYSCAEKAHSSSSMGWTFKITAWLIWTGHWVFFLDSWTFKCQWICQESTGMISADIHVWPIYSFIPNEDHSYWEWMSLSRLRVIECRMFMVIMLWTC